MTLGTERRGVYKNMTYLDQERVEFDWEFPLGEIILDFFDKMKTVSRGYASLDYEMLGYRESDLVRLDMLINGDPIDAFSSSSTRTRPTSGGGRSPTSSRSSSRGSSSRCASRPRSGRR
jgi:GTP-binding protein LepA